MTMTGDERRAFIIEEIKNKNKPIPAKKLAELCNVSRQIIVQDIALIRAAGYDIISTNRGYILTEEKAEVSRIFKVNHSDVQTEEEMNAIVDLGGNIVNVSIHHKVYGQMEAPLGVNSRKKVRDFMEDMKNGKSSPLKNITSGYHYHKIEAESEEILDMIEAMLKEKGMLVEK